MNASDARRMFEAMDEARTNREWREVQQAQGRGAVCPHCGLCPYEEMPDGSIQVTCCRKGDLSIAWGFTEQEILLVEKGVGPLRVLRMRRQVKAMAKKSDA